MTEKQAQELIEGVIKSTNSEVKIVKEFGEEFYEIKNINLVNNYGVKGMIVKVNKNNGYIQTAFPVRGDAVWAWNNNLKEFILQNW